MRRDDLEPGHVETDPALRASLDSPPFDPASPVSAHPATVSTHAGSRKAVYGWTTCKLCGRDMRLQRTRSIGRRSNGRTALLLPSHVTQWGERCAASRAIVYRSDVREVA
jgi:hypothetical protein